MDMQEAQLRLMASLNEVSQTFQKIPGSDIVIRYIQASYQDDPIRSAVELVLLIFFIRYLLSPSYATHDPNYVKLSEDEIDELVAEWEPEPLVASRTPFQENEADKAPMIVGYALEPSGTY
jgi:serine palmitoyltransferase